MTRTTERRPHAAALRVAIVAAWLVLSVAVLTPRPAAAPPVYPTVTVTVHRIIAVDPVEGLPGDPADWSYFVGVDDGSGFVWDGSGDLPDNVDDLIVDQDHLFQVQATSVTVAILLCEDDILPPPDDERADLSNDTAGGADDVDCSPPPSGTDGGTYVGTWNLLTDGLYGGGYDNVTGYFQASGDSDGSISVDENDANLQFLVADNYNLPGADVGPPRFTFIDVPLTFNASASTASPGSSLVSYDWDFGDGATDSSTSPLTSHVYTAKGTFTVTLWVNDSLGMTSVDATTVDVLNREPDAAFTFSPANPSSGEEVQFLDTSVDLDGSIVSRVWNFGDGGTSTAANPTHTYADDGNYTVSLTVTDDDDATNVTFAQVDVRNRDPVAAFTHSPVNPEVGDPVQFTDASTDSDGTLAAWSWDFGDGDAAASQSPTHTYDEEGNYTVTLTVTDDDGGQGSWSTEVVVGPRTAAPPFDWLPVILFIVLILVILVAVYLWRYFSHEQEEE